jgi:hypothetical protein
MLLAGSVAVLALAAAACAAPNSNTSLNPNMVALTNVPWCDQPSISFQDDGKLSHPTLTDWSAVKSQLGFTPYLPTALPKGTCLVLAGGSIHDPVFGGHFRITYNLPMVGPLSFSEAPKHTGQAGSQSNTVKCSGTTSGPTPTPAKTPTATPSATQSAPLAVCLGVIADTNVSVASAQSTGALESLFNSLQPNVTWVPRVASQRPQPSPTATATAAP